MAGLDCSKLVPSEWMLKNEGACNIILSFCGPSCSPYYGHVLRLRKVSSSVQAADPRYGPLSLLPPELIPHPSTWADSSWTSFIFAKYIAGPSLGSSPVNGGTSYVDAGRVLALSSRFLERISAQVFASRPEYRRKTALDCTAKFGLLLLDYTGPVHPSSPVLAVEIKPKWGFLPFSHADPADMGPMDLVKARVCRYCLHQSHKRPPDAPRSRYCPLDLFSGDPLRIRSALSALLADPQNNFRIYWQGRLRLGDPLSAEDHSWASCCSPPRLLDILQHALSIDPVLDRIRSLQLLDSLDISRLYPLYCDDAPTPTPGSSVSHPFTLSSSLNPFRLSLSAPPADFPLPPSALFRDFLISTSFKDCSLMFTLSHPSPSLSPSPSSDPSLCNFLGLSLHVIDLDIRDASRIPDWWCLDHTIVNSYLESHSSPQQHRSCSESATISSQLPDEFATDVDHPSIPSVDHPLITRPTRLASSCSDSRLPHASLSSEHLAL